jgi:hypothetical protein
MYKELEATKQVICAIRKFKSVVHAIMREVFWLKSYGKLLGFLK